MNRRGLMKFLGIGAAAVVGSTPSILAESISSEQSKDDIWITEQCKHHIDDSGKYQLKPSNLKVLYAQTNAFSCWDSPSKEKAQMKITEAYSQYEDDLRKWSSSPICGVKFKRLRGVTTRCPNCAGQSSGDKDRGIWLSLTN